MRVTFTLTTLASTMALIWVKMARDNSIKAGNMLRNLKYSYKSKWVLKKDGSLGLHLETMNEKI